MSDWVVFEGVVEPLDWGKATYTILRVPDVAAAALGATRRVEGEIAEHWVNLALSRAPVVEGVFLWAGASLLDRAGIVPGKPVEVRLRPAPEDQVDTPEDVAAALRAADMTAVWDGLTAGKRRGMLYQIGSAKTAPTRAKRIDAMIEGLR
ncbi:YdeI/OmpD-associated family protein [Fuscovulum ytuae]|uniref:YdeI/OmpD-associated family protein n=1 Tax=Fuscovulum ytuae TaxID=3042299 RepID=A0ABY8Q2Y3_9RHOB|nr:YdeI/OmpD-associated family protein [Fuscovulum sp. YMD61]WGV14710.1 YdeI/OmpD-associated family protein [Fuscovulum sp. YMD61]